MSLAKRIRDCRYAKGWGPDELALRAEISRTALYQIERGKTETPRAGTLRRIACALDVSIDALLGNAEWDLDEIAAMTAVQEPEVVRPPVADPRLVAPQFATRSYASGRERELERKLLELLASPLGDGVARIVEESHRLLPTLRLA
ncbi:MAG: putative transcriptional regulator [Planctomycetota bacterium]|nr:putative transcriptional regulator [Planctomycetota bacterium]